MRLRFVDPYPCHKPLLAKHWWRHRHAALSSAWRLVFEWVDDDMMSALRAHFAKKFIAKIFQAWADQIQPDPSSESSEDNVTRTPFANRIRLDVRVYDDRVYDDRVYDDDITLATMRQED